MPGINGGLSKRMSGQAGISNTINIPSIDEYSKKILENGGQLLIPKIPIPKKDGLHNVQIQKETSLE